MRPSLDLSVVIPAHNERPALDPLYRELRDALDPTGLRYELIFVDDGSDDGSWGVLEALRLADAERVRVIRMRANSGQTAALDAGFRLARGATIASIDADGENDPRDLPALLARLGDGYDVVCGWRRARGGSLLSRRLPSKVANKLIAIGTGVTVHDCGCTLRVYRASAVRALALYAEMHRLLPAVAWLAGARVGEAPVAHRARRGGRSHYGLSRAWKVVVDVAALILIARIAARPTRWLTGAAVPFLALGVGALAFVAADAGLWGTASATAAGAGRGFPMVAPSCALLFLFLAIYLALSGILGEALLEGCESEVDAAADAVERLA